MLNVELLAPAGSPESLEVAIAAGADAVYLGVGKFGARQFAANFNDAQLKNAVKGAHDRGVAIYVTMNTLIKEEEFAEALEIVDTLYRADVDALILQDLGLARAVAERYPSFERHASTQMTAQSAEDVLFLERMGFDRVVVSREMTIDELRDVRRKTSIALEVFVHGALCTGYSGACLMSAYIGGRSGNRGACAQPCRLAYEAIDREGKTGEKGHFLSKKDLMILDRIEEILPLAPVSLKIEGRMKSPAYVSGVVEAYRRAIDGQGDGHAVNRMARLFNRGFTTGHLFSDVDMAAHDLPGHRGVLVGEVVDAETGYLHVRLSSDLTVQDDIQVEVAGSRRVGGRVEKLFVKGDPVETGGPGQVVKMPFKHRVSEGAPVYKTFDVRLNDRLSVEVLKGRAPVAISGSFELSGHKVPLLTLTDGARTVSVSGDQAAEPAKKAPLTNEKVGEQIDKMGDTPYVLSELEITLSPNLFLPVSELNALRRKAVAALSDLRSTWHPERAGQVAPPPYVSEEPVPSTRPPLAVVQVRTIEQLEIARAHDVQAIYVEGDLAVGSDPRLLRIGGYVGKADPDAGVARTLGDLPHATVADFTLNVFNNRTLSFLAEEGVTVAVVSPELTLEEIRKLHAPGIEKEVIAYGKLPLMTIRNRGTMRREDLFALSDDREQCYPYRALDSEHHQVFTPVPIGLDPERLVGVCDRYRILLTDETADETETVLKAYLRDHRGVESPSSRGGFYSGVR